MNVNIHLMKRILSIFTCKMQKGKSGSGQVKINDIYIIKIKDGTEDKLKNKKKHAKQHVDILNI